MPGGLKCSILTQTNDLHVLQENSQMCRLSFRNLGGLMKIWGVGHMTTFVIPKQEARTFLATTAGGRQHVVGGRGKDLELERTGKEYLLLCCLKWISGADFVHLWNGDTITYLKAAAGCWGLRNGTGIFLKRPHKIYFPMPFPMSTLYWLLKCTLERMRKECVSPEKRANKCLSSFLMGTHALEVRGNDRGTPHPAVQEGTPQDLSLWQVDYFELRSLKVLGLRSKF